MPKSKHIPERSCLACGNKLPKRELLRVVRAPDGRIIPDPSGKSAGRGAYLCRREACWQKGLRKGGLERGLRAAVSAAEREALWQFYQQQAAQVPPEEELNDN